MRFDDRLSTVLAQPATDAHDRAVRWRQLVELVARSGGGPTGRLTAEALAQIRQGAADVDPAVRAATARAIAAMPLSADLVAIFAADSLSVAAPLLAAASFHPSQWDRVFGEASEENRRFLLALHPELGNRPPPASAAEISPPAPLPSSESPIPSISDVVARIERLRQSRDHQPLDTAPAGEGRVGAGALFRWECTPSGEIAWVDGAPRGAIIGRSIAQPSDQDVIDPAVGRAFSMRAPFRDASLVLAGDADWAGEWRISGAPAFEPSDGRFAGYRGVAVRTGIAAGAAEPGQWGEHDSLRELIHEIKTPLNAIIGFAEIIDGQLLGAAGQGYRERAAVIVEEARLLLAAVDDLDLAARLTSGREQAGDPVNAVEMLERLRPQLAQSAERSGVALTFQQDGGAQGCIVHPVLAERMVVRLAEVVLSAAAPGEQLTLKSRSADGRCTLTVELPAALRAAISKAGARDARPEEAESFQLRLLHGLAQLGGGNVEVTDGHLKLTLPRS